jgi:succinate dehydrogenase flavin-adding protein (antitoxin of CptAB toxin-antitoxin module)
LLEQEDDVLFDWISGRNLPAEPAMLALIKTLINAP